MTTLSRIHEIEAHLEEIKDRAMLDRGVEEETLEKIPLVDPPRPELGERGFPVFLLMRALEERNPKAVADKLAAELNTELGDDPLVGEVIAEGPYVNFKLKASALAQIVLGQVLEERGDFGADALEIEPQTWMVEFSSPNTNKPLHLGHVRNNILGEAFSRMLELVGHTVYRVNLINDRGIHICKSMLAYKEHGEGVTPQEAGLKGDALVAKFYVMFEQRFTEEYELYLQTEQGEADYQEWLDSPASGRAKKKAAKKIEKLTKKAAEEIPSEESLLRAAFYGHFKDRYFNVVSPLGARATAMLQAWEAGDEEVHALWRKLNDWVLQGHEETYARMGVSFDKLYFESDTYKLGKDIVQEGLEKGVLYELEDGAVAFDKANIGMKGEKILLRSNGTSVYMTQDLGTAVARFEEDWGIDQLGYVVGDEQDHHFQVLFGVLSQLYPELEGKLHHLSYGMVELPEGRMKTREGRVVDADDLMDGLQELVGEGVREHGPELGEEEIARRSDVIGKAALKYYLLDFNPRTTVSFDPEASIQSTGRTGVYALYTYARARSVGRKVESSGVAQREALGALGSDREMDVVRALMKWPHSLQVGLRELDPSKLTESLFEVCSAYNALFNDPEHKMIEMEDGPRKDGLLLLTEAVAAAVTTVLGVLGIERLEEM